MKIRSLFAITLMLALVSAPVVLADPAVYAGDDLWYTPPGGGQLAGISIPAGFFCNGASPAMALPTTNMEGFPLVTSPSLAPVDTVIERPKDAPFINNVAVTTIRIQALMMKSVNAVLINCGSYFESYTAYVGLEPQDAGHQPDGMITIRRASPASTGGRFDASFDVLGRAFFVNNATNKILGPISHAPQTVTTINACWSHTPGPGAFVSGPFAVDTDTDLVVDTVALGTSNFFPGWCPSGPGGTGPPVANPVKHEGPHPETCSAPGCPPPWVPPTHCDPVIIGAISKHVIKEVGLDVEAATLTVAREEATDVNELTAFRVRHCAKELGAAIFIEP